MYKWEDDGVNDDDDKLVTMIYICQHGWDGRFLSSVAGPHSAYSWSKLHWRKKVKRSSDSRSLCEHGLGCLVLRPVLNYGHKSLVSMVIVIQALYCNDDNEDDVDEDRWWQYRSVSTENSAYGKHWNCEPVQISNTHLSDNFTIKSPKNTGMRRPPSSGAQGRCHTYHTFDTPLWQ